MFGVPVQTRHGMSKDVCYSFTYENPPRVDIEVGEEIVIRDIEEVPQDVIEILARMFKRGISKTDLISYAQAILRGEISRMEDGKFAAEYTYGQRARKWGLQYAVALDLMQRGGKPRVEEVGKYIEEAVSKAPLIDQLEIVVKMLARDRGARYAVVCMWDVWSDLAGSIINQPCWLIIQFRILNGALHTYTYCRSHDFARAHPDNIIAITAIAEYVRKRLCEELKEEIKMGALSGFVASNHVYV
jgi:thymidylate synthase